MEMRKALVGLLVVLVATMAMAQDVPFSDKDLESEESMWSLYERWRSMYTSSLDLADKDRKFEVFKKNARYINDFNKKEGMTYKLGLNKFADMTLEEFTAMYTGAKVDASDAFASVSEPEEWEEQLVGSTPTTWDWRQHGVVTSVKDQSPCGSCWAFSAVGAVEGIHAIATGQLLTLSEQQVLDCSGAGTCKGGWPDRVLQNFATRQGITLARYYPAYSAQQQACRTQPNSPVVKVHGAYPLPTFNEAALMQRVSKQPVVVVIEANESFQFYKEGVYAGPCGTSLNHAVLAVGYGVTRDNINYWIIKNSWGANWGESGYIRMKRGVSREGICGITLQSVYPILYGAYPTKKSSKHCPSSTDDATVASI